MTNQKHVRKGVVLFTPSQCTERHCGNSDFPVVKRKREYGETGKYPHFSSEADWT